MAGECTTRKLLIPSAMAEREFGDGLEGRPPHGDSRLRKVMKMGFFDTAYEGTPPWDIGRPQPEFVRLADSGMIRGRVLDVGCGTGENALLLAARGHEVWGVDGAARAIAKAQRKARTRALGAKFLVQDALHLGKLATTFDTVIDSGLFHVFSDEERPVFVRSLVTVLREGGTYYMMCFSEREPGEWGPRRVTQREIRGAFRNGWRIELIRAAMFEANVEGGGAHAWLSSIIRL